jgi:hypothetical protein
VYRIRKEANANKNMLSSPKTFSKTTSLSEKYDNFTNSAIQAKVYKLFFRNELPTLNEILAVVNSGTGLPYLYLTTLHRLLKD